MKVAFPERYSIFIFSLLILCITIAVPIYLFGKGFDLSVMTDGAGGDGYGIHAFVKSIIENGISGIYYNPHIGAPEGSFLAYYPFLDFFMAICIYCISLFTQNTSTIIYIYYIGTYCSTALVMFWVMRKLEFDNILSFVIALLFSFAPYHFYHYMVHLTLANYISFPLIIYIASYILGILEEKKYKIVIACIAVGLGYGYYYAFGLILLSIAFCMRMLSNNNWKDNIKYSWPIFIILLFVFIALLPTFYTTLCYGRNIKAGTRVFYEQEYQGLKIIQMLLPMGYHRFHFLSQITAKYNSVAPLITENRWASLGIISSLFFLLGLFTYFVNSLGKFTFFAKRNTLFLFLSISTLILLLFGTIGGFGEIFNWLVTPQIRCYCRMSILIIELSLLIGAIFLSRIENRKKIYYGLISVILCIGLIDQIPHRNKANWQAGIKVQDEMYNAYFSKLENSLPKGSSVYNLPYMDFPEVHSLYNIPDYHLFHGYLHTKTLKWSYGAVKGRNNIAKQIANYGETSKKFLYALKKHGFSGLLIDIDGYKDNGKAILAQYNKISTIPPLISGDKKLYFYYMDKLNIDDESLCLKLGSFFYLDKAHYNVLNIAISGLSRHEEWGTWTDAYNGTFKMEFSVPKTANEILSAKFDLAMIFNGKQRVIIKVNGKKIIQKEVVAGRDWVLEFQFKNDKSKEKQVIEIELPDSKSPYKLGQNNDDRKLAIGIKSFTIF